MVAPLEHTAHSTLVQPAKISATDPWERPVAATKTGMLATAEVVGFVAEQALEVQRACSSVASVLGRRFRASRYVAPA